MYQFINVSQLREAIFRNGLDQHILVKLGYKTIQPYDHCEHRMRELATTCDIPLTYSWYREMDGTLDLEDGVRAHITDHPLPDYQLGSLRDDFDFGSLVLLNAADVLAATEDFDDEEDSQPDGGWYALRLRLLAGRGALCINEYLYWQSKTDYRESGEMQHDYVDPHNADYQKAMEKVCLTHLEEINALTGPKQRVNVADGIFPVEASVVIPVRNRVHTIIDAVRSALSQKTDFDFNVIVVDNASTDGTREALRDVENEDSRLHVIDVMNSDGLGIGGCWNKAVLSEECGRFAVQLDSDDVYSSQETLQKIVDKFYEDRCAMVVGSYTLTDFDMNVIPPGEITHSEWTDEHGADNALRINGFGAPRAFYTPVIREVLFPNVSYGEDYAAALRISRSYKVGRIFKSLYYCRRWSGNSDAALPIVKVNENNTYKDFIRTVEVLARIHDNIERRDNELPF